MMPAYDIAYVKNGSGLVSGDPFLKTTYKESREYRWLVNTSPKKISQPTRGVFGDLDLLLYIPETHITMEKTSTLSRCIRCISNGRNGRLSS